MFGRQWSGVAAFCVMSETSLNLADVNSRPRRCARCGCGFPFVEPSTPGEKRELQEIAFQGQPTLFMNRLKNVAHCDLGSAKAVFAHIVLSPGVCRRCRGPIQVAEYSDCPKCKSFNIWWGDAT
jgi:predicted Zn-ribbon and HTH transcriptional regulator